ncbi:hypothetical protein [Roseicyclus persicicus]|uniref:Uncharacterized protein n=1 Tax=Roseicyclus persicicus TaxID=2650661 RepID=A0A7X6GVU6_9RHOB|nr:hypothetical protein [Roseibacterium persicicum]NKX43314.1 hypothetical protein [Roseibacterium persicicum]
MWARAFPILLAGLLPGVAPAQTCRFDYAIAVTQGVGEIRPGARMSGDGAFTLLGDRLQGEGDSTVHLARGEMRLGDGIRGEIWAIVTTAPGPAADLLGVYARDVEGMSFAGLDYAGPMLITLYGRIGTLAGDLPPLTQDGWDAMDLSRRFALHAQGYDRLAGDVTALAINCRDALPVRND